MDCRLFLLRKLYWNVDEKLCAFYLKHVQMTILTIAQKARYGHLPANPLQPTRWTVCSANFCAFCLGFWGESQFHLGDTLDAFRMRWCRFLLHALYMWFCLTSCALSYSCEWLWHASLQRIRQGTAWKTGEHRPNAAFVKFPSPVTAKPFKIDSFVRVSCFSLMFLHVF